MRGRRILMTASPTTTMAGPTRPSSTAMCAVRDWTTDAAPLAFPDAMSAGEAVPDRVVNQHARVIPAEQLSSAIVARRGHASVPRRSGAVVKLSLSWRFARSRELPSMFDLKNQKEKMRFTNSVQNRVRN